MSASSRGPLRRFGAVLVAALALAGAVSLAAPASAASGPNIDPDTVGSLTIHKYQSPNEDPGLPNNGTEVDDSDLTPLGGVEFTLTAVTDIDLTTNDGWDEAAELADAVAAGGGLDGHTTAAVGARTTAADGSAVFDDLALGVYYVQETDPGDHPIVASVAPFIVTIPLPTTVDGQSRWLYDVHVYPKNALSGTEKTIDDSEATGLGDTVSFGIDSDIPSFYGTEELSSYSIVDELDPRLAFTASSAVVTAEDSDGEAITLTEGADFTVTEPSTATGGTLTIEFTDDGIEALAAAPGGTVHVAFETTVKSIGDGTITNDSVTYINDVDIVSNSVETLWGAIRIVKYDAETDVELAGAVFEVYGSSTGGEPISVDGQTQFTTGDDGSVIIPGVKAGTYWIDEVVAPDRYLPFDGRIEVVVTAGSLDEAVEVRVANRKIPDMELPLTGGDGGAWLIAGGIALVAIAAGSGLLLARHRARR